MPRRAGLFVAVHVSPRARANHLGTVDRAADRRLSMTARLTAPPEDGRANEALLRLLAQVWRLPRHDIAIVAGTAGRRKIVHIVGDPHQLRGWLGIGSAAADR